MKIPDLKLINFENHHEKCRICFNDIKKSEKNLLITSRTQGNFHSLTGLELHMHNSQLSKLICTKCHTQLKDISAFTKSICEIQKKYYKFVDLSINSSSNDFLVPEIKCEAFDLSYEDIKQEDQSCLFDSATYLQLYKNENPLKVDEPINEDQLDDTDSDDDYFLDRQDSKKKERNKKEEVACVCDICGEHKTSKKSLKYHVQTVHPNGTSFSCKVQGCIKVFPTKFQLIGHHNRMHIDRVKKVQKHICDHCGYATVYKYSFIEHMNKHMDDSSKKIFSCKFKDCLFTTYTRSHLKRHKNREHIGRITCECGKTFASKKTLDSHKILIHFVAPKPYSCDLCDKTYLVKQPLHQHIIATHLKTRNFACDKCKKRFYTLRLLRLHKIYHQEPTFSCTECGKAFYFETRLREHEKIHSENREKQCHLCPKSYYTTNHLRLHLDVAHQRRTFYCELCSFTNNRKDYLRNHLRSSHKLSKKEQLEILKRVKVVQIDV